MPYKTNKDLPENVKNHLPKHAQDIFREAFNHAHEEYSDPSKRRDPDEELDTVCFKVAWAAVHNKYEKGEDKDWHRF
ncbi:hypothetical protein DICPUDRAFT_152726 [Dictyostelium purpureum]|uniref:Cation transport regulator ChaB n=1 Tax=Dictyostelium purpureum TaxID=5786 RepID=F0ZM48_DICPU|nr:uncharacterized protein DICPUDRAFT_152726 [Dictyostelium purpureum]EGC34963.1 hypothetical protein DICPUDRAFT_152726 [Dictyostelium purpureum]|eukprot:XP_003288488.1 hypothetical protein DICPUDRAFT_152726 [Dictyostelium purpureum]